MNHDAFDHIVLELLCPGLWARVARGLMSGGLDLGTSDPI